MTLVRTAGTQAIPRPGKACSAYMRYIEDKKETAAHVVRYTETEQMADCTLFIPRRGGLD
jgi:hypothetical protein